MKKSRISISRVCLLLLAVLFIAGISTTAYAKYEITKSDVTSDVPTDGVTIVKWTQDVTIEWKKPTIASGDVLQGFVYKWNTTATPLTDLTEANADGTVSSDLNPPYVTKLASFFAADDSDVIRYLHIRTWFYDNTAMAMTYSSDVVIGGINIDNVAPTGTVRITDSEGGDINSTYSTSLNLRLSASKAPTKAYVNETANRATATSYTYASNVTYALKNMDPGTKTIYVWFEDAVGNVSSAAVTDTVTLLSSVSISPYDGTFDISLGSKDFIVDGSSAAYDWSIIEETPDKSGDDVAQISSGATGSTTGVTVSLLNPGTFKLQAVAGATTITSGTIRVAQSSVDVVFILQKNEGKTSVNAISLAVPVDGLSKASDLWAAVPNIDGLSKWDVDNQIYSSYVPNVAVTDFNLVVGEPYFVSVSDNDSYTMTGSEVEISFNLQKNTGKTSVNAISLPISVTTLEKASNLYADVPNIDGLSRWDVDNQIYSSYVPNVAITDFFLDPGEPYFVSVSANGVWP